MILTLSKADRRLRGEITLAGSKSISNRALIIRALTGDPFPIHKLANARDTQLLDALLQSQEPVRDAGAAGTTFRFLTAYLSLQPGEQILTGTERMKQRPIGVLVDALRRLGARIDYLEREGYPPLRIGESASFRGGYLRIPASTSSQYISALLMIAPVLPAGLTLELDGKVVSRPYIEMTLNLMQYFGVSHDWEGNTIRVPYQHYAGRPFTVEADWSAASYYYAMVALAEAPDLQLNGLFADSVQGDAILAEMMEDFGVVTTFNEQGLRLRRAAGNGRPSPFYQDFLRCPDLAQTLAVICAALGVEGTFTGLETLRIKETDRIAALDSELTKVGARFLPLTAAEAPGPGAFFRVQGQAQLLDKLVFMTYEDHRMAMAFAPLAMLGPIRIAEPMVVEKSYPDFWKDLASLGFEMKTEEYRT